MLPRPPRSTRTDTLLPYTTLFRSRAKGRFPGLLVLMDTGFAAEHTSPYNIRVALHRSEEHTSELQSLMRNSYAVFCLKKKIETHRWKRSTHRILHSPSELRPRCS